MGIDETNERPMFEKTRRFNLSPGALCELLIGRLSQSGSSDAVCCRRLGSAVNQLIPPHCR